MTSDLDILIEATEENARRLLTVLSTWGEGAGAALGIEELAVPQPGALRVVEGFALDVFTIMRARTSDHDFTYADLIADAHERNLSNGTKVVYASISRLLDLKAGTGRPKDVSDMAILNEIALGKLARLPVDLAAMEGNSAADPSEQGEWPTHVSENPPNL